MPMKKQKIFILMRKTKYSSKDCKGVKFSNNRNYFASLRMGKSFKGQK